MPSRIWVLSGSLAAASLICWQPAWSQGRGTSTGSSTSSSTTSTTTSTTTTTGTGTTGTRTMPTMDPSASTSNTTGVSTTSPIAPPPVMISGRVMLEDGTPPPETAVIERVCNGNPHGEGYTDTKGYFVIQLGQGMVDMADASESGSGLSRTFPQSSPGFGGMGSGMGSGTRTGGMFDNRYAACEIRARLAGYRSQSVSLASRHAMDSPEIGVILLHRLGPDEGTTVDVKTLAAPKPAQKAFNKGMDLLRKQKSDEAETNFRKAVELFPDFAEAWLEVGKIEAVAGHTDQAREAFQSAVKAQPKAIPAYLELSLLAIKDKNWTEVARVTDEVLKLDSFEYPQAYFFNAVANYNLHNFKVAEQRATSAKRLDTRHAYPEVSHLLGVLMLDRRDYADAATQLRDYLVAAPNATDATQVRKQLDELEKRTIPASAVVQKEDK